MPVTLRTLGWTRARGAVIAILCAFARSEVLCGRSKFFLSKFCFSREASEMSDKPTTREELLRRQKNWQAPVRIGILDEFRMLELLPTR